MAWTAPRLWTQGELVTASMMNLSVSDNLAYLKGQAGVVNIENTITAPTVSTTNLFATWITYTGSDLLTGIPSKLAGQQGGDGVLRWSNETNWLRSGIPGEVRGSGSIDLGSAGAATNLRRFRALHAWQGSWTVSASGSAGILIGTQNVGSVVIANGDSYTFYATDSNYWEVI